MRERRSRTIGARVESVSASAPEAEARSAERPTWKISRDDLADGGAVLLLGLIGLVGFQSVFDGWRFLVVGLWAAVVGIACATIISIRRLPPLAGVLVSITGFILGAAPAVPLAALGGVFPGPDTPAGLRFGMVHGWSNLLTTAPPVGFESGMGLVPYTCAFSGAVAAMVLARRTRLALVPALASLVALLAGLAFGTIEPVSTAIQGAGFAGVAIAWGAVRGNRDRRSVDGSVYWPRVVSGATMLALVALAGGVFGSNLPFTHARSRTVLREETVPPFNPESYPSPLARFRAFTTKSGRADVLFKVEGLPAKSRIRLSTMDTFDGTVWMVSGQQHAGSGRFERVGRRILGVPPGESASIAFEVVGYSGTWVPSVGSTRSIAFAGATGEMLAEDFRYNRTTGTGAAPNGIGPGDEFTLDTRLPTLDTRSELVKAQADGSQDLPGLPSDPSSQKALAEIQKTAFKMVGKSAGPYAQATALATELRKGGYTDGARGTVNVSQTPAGHSIARIAQFLEHPNGNAEQYAAAMALMARQLGLPARVVLGLRPKGHGSVEVKGSDIDAWVEIAFDGHGWVPFDPTPDRSTKVPDKQKESVVQRNLEQQPPPPNDYLDPPDEVDVLAGQKAKRRPTEEEPVVAQKRISRSLVLALTFGGIPLGIVGGIAAVIVGLKALRRRRRRSNGSAVAQVNGAWLELVDKLRDAGHRPSKRATRVEFAGAVPEEQWPSSREFADQVDRVMFGPDEPDASAAEGVWSSLEDQVRAIHLPLNRRQRAKAALSLASLKPSRS